jgi:hypothetical protein
MNQSYRLLAFCARAEGFPAFYEQLICQLEQFTAWANLPAQAELHGMAPLLRHHIIQSGFPLPLETRQTLTGLYLRHRELNKGYAQSLVEITSLLEGAGIRPLLLKGLGLAYQYYPVPALRPTSDIDLLVQANEIAQVQHLLAETGYNPAFPNLHLGWASNEMTAHSPLKNGISTRIEIHRYEKNHRVYDDLSADEEFSGFDLPPVTINIGGQAVQVPAPMDNLRYLSRHIAHHLPNATSGKPVQLKWSADIISLVEKHADSIDWKFIRKHDPASLARLAVIFSLTPLNPACTKHLPFSIPKQPKGVNQYPGGWPKKAFRQTSPDKWGQVLIQTFKPPSEWWLRLYYGIHGASVFWYARILYPLRILKMLSLAFIRSVRFSS